ncbi:GAF domain-containing protein [Pseudomonas sp. MAFF 302046]|jgi:GAF domain-containing protein|uniref:GAF domain-containing protein n=1 Tax=Pseudomonas morbosilactucae TaxID=2938197 RepID=A0ABT0JM71_9PSED|nr:GAF domain-containing protein [Pseudomonas morbosilactucae]MCK9817025.1 GAF domain-containing protein [Pseudomonas morbosilactucae]
MQSFARENGGLKVTGINTTAEPFKVKSALGIDLLTAEEIATIAEIEATSDILTQVTRLTSLRFAAIAKVTEQRWIACAVHDELHFGLGPGDELMPEATLCNELRQHGKPIIIQHASAEPVFAQHPVPKMYGFESYISLPIVFSDGTFFGTLCALDPQPAKLHDPYLLETLQVFTRLIATALERPRLAPTAS